MSSNFEFIDIKRIEPETKSIKVRKIEFGEIYQTQNLESVQRAIKQMFGLRQSILRVEMPTS